MRKKPVFPAAVALICLSAATGPVTRAAVKPCDPAPRIMLRDQAGKVHRIPDTDEKPDRPKDRKNTLLIFFATGTSNCCLDSIELFRHFEKNKSWTETTRIYLVAVTLEPHGRQELQDLLRRHQPPFPVLEDRYETAIKKYASPDNFFGLPLLVLIGDDGKVLAVVTNTHTDLDAALKPAKCPVAEEQAAPGR